MEIVQDGWLSELFDSPVFRLDGASDDEATAAALGAHVRAQARAFYYAKLDARYPGVVRRLGTQGMFVVDTNVTLELNRPPSPGTDPEGLTVGVLDPAEADAVLRIAGSAYAFSRFHLDPFVAPELAHKIKYEWCKNYVLGKRGDRLFVAKSGNKPVGFLCAIKTDHGAVIDLIGVDLEHRRKRAGVALTRAFVAHYEGSGSLQVGTQVANWPSLRLYERLGFSVLKSQYVMHLHVVGGAPR